MAARSIRGRFSMPATPAAWATLAAVTAVIFPGAIQPASAATSAHHTATREHRAVHSAPKALTVPQIQIWTQNTIRYMCDGRKPLTVHYSNTKNEQSFALLSVKGRDTLFVSVTAASGVKYVAGQYSWWPKGPQGDLRDETAGDNGTALLTNCKAQQ